MNESYKPPAQEAINTTTKKVDTIHPPENNAASVYSAKKERAALQNEKEIATTRILIKNEMPNTGNLELKERALDFFENELTGEKLIPTPQKKECEIACVVPVYNEDKERVIKQLESFIGQKNISKDQFEAIYIINNDPNSPDEVKRKNKEILGLPIWRNRQANEDGLDEETKNKYADIREHLNLFAIDKSTEGNATPDNNVGRARNRGLAEASYRFYNQDKNGIVFQTDADSYLEDPEFFSNIIKEFKNTPDAIGIVGGLEHAIDFDEKDPVKLAELRKKLDIFALERKYTSLRKFKDKLDDNQEERLKIPQNEENENAMLIKTPYSGANMISRSLESAVVQGFPDISAGEDPAFSERLYKLTESRNKIMIDRKEEKDKEKQFNVTTVMRESDRTPSGFGRIFENIKLDEAIPVKDFKDRKVHNVTLSEYNQLYQELKEELLGGNKYSKNDQELTRDWIKFIEETADRLVRDYDQRALDKSKATN
ncbi:MAG: glycosyltransferase family A protein [Patescibacteria group bacterium]